jgi:ribosomal protein S10
MYLNIVISSKNNTSLKFFLKVFRNLSQNKNLQLNTTLKICNKPRLNKVFTVLKSPHVNKSAQEQFELNIFSKNVIITTFQVLKILILIKKIQSMSFSDINIKIKFVIFNNLKKNMLINNLKFKKIKIRGHNRNFLLKQIIIYLVFVNFYGKYNF